MAYLIEFESVKNRQSSFTVYTYILTRRCFTRLGPSQRVEKKKLELFCFKTLRKRERPLVKSWT